jgi:uncharacterized protein YdiU (UPF0061 family)
MRGKLGLRTPRPDDEALISDLLALLQANRVDYTNFFRALGPFQTGSETNNNLLRDMFIDRAVFGAWARRYRERLLAEDSRDAERQACMARVNPKFVLRNYLAHNAIALAVEQKDYTEIDQLLKLLRDPFSEQPGMEAYAASSPNWGKHLIVSCSS